MSFFDIFRNIADLAQDKNWVIKYIEEGRSLQALEEQIAIFERPTLLEMYYKDSELCTSLLRAGAVRGVNAVIEGVALIHHHVDKSLMLELLLKTGANPNSLDRGHTLIEVLLSRDMVFGNPERDIEILLKYGADASIGCPLSRLLRRQSYGYNAISHTLIETLLEAGAQPNLEDFKKLYNLEDNLISNKSKILSMVAKSLTAEELKPFMDNCVFEGVVAVYERKVLQELAPQKLLENTISYNRNIYEFFKSF